MTFLIALAALTFNSWGAPLGADSPIVSFSERGLKIQLSDSKEALTLFDAMDVPPVASSDEVRKVLTARSSEDALTVDCRKEAARSACLLSYTRFGYAQGDYLAGAEDFVRVLELSDEVSERFFQKLRLPLSTIEQPKLQLRFEERSFETADGGVELSVRKRLPRSGDSRFLGSLRFSF